MNTLQSSSFTSLTDTQSFSVNPLPSEAPVAWHLTERRANDLGHSSRFSWYFGREVEGDYNVGTQVTGTLTSPALNLSSISTSTTVQLSFNHWLLTEGAAGVDTAKVRISKDDGVTFQDLATLSDTNSWQQIALTIPSNIRTNKVRIQFIFDSFDYIRNDFEGWYVDDFKVETLPLKISSGSATKKYGSADGERFGSSVTRIGKYDSTEAAEFAVLSETTGSVNVFSGSKFSSVAKLAAPTNLSLVGYQLASAGLFDGDTYEDFLLSPTIGTYAPNSPAWVIFGNSANGSLSTLNSSRLNESGGLVSLGDINGDRVIDLGHVSAERTQRQTESGDELQHLVGQVFFGTTNLRSATNWVTPLASPAITVEADQPFYVTLSGDPSQKYSFGAVGQMLGDSKKDFAIADAIPGASLHLFRGRSIAANPNASAILVQTDSSRTYQYVLSTPITDIPVSAGLTISTTSTNGNSRSQANVFEAHSLEGAFDGEQLSAARPVGDINGDMITDYEFHGTRNGYILFGPIELTETSDIPSQADLSYDLQAALVASSMGLATLMVTACPILCSGKRSGHLCA